MNVLVTGGAGYVGSRVVADLLAHGARVTVFDRLVYGAQALLPFGRHPSFRLIAGDVRDEPALRAAMSGHEAVVHLAAVVGEAACDLDPQAAEAINRDAAIAALRIAESARVARFIFFSTCSNYGVSDSSALADEDAALKPMSLYARTKVAVENAALAMQTEMAVTVLRLGTICGLSGRMRFDLLVSEMARAAALGEPIEIYKPDAWRPFLHVADAGRVVEHVLSCERGRVRGRVFNVVGENYQKRGLMDLVRKHYPDAHVSITDAKPDNRDYRVSDARIREQLGFSTRYTVEDAFVETARAVADGVFVDPHWAGHSAIPQHRSILVAKP
jgi:nucleoside-diphosphate-sugar epimerase